MAQITLRDYLQETEDAIGSEQIDKALANCQSILAHFPDSLEGQRLLGEVYLAQGRLEDAQHAFDWVLSNDPENVIVYCSRALVSQRLSDFDTALDCYQQAYELSKGNSRIRQAFNTLSEQIGQQGFMLSRAGLARLYMRGDLLDQSIQEWEVVLAAMPDRLDARTGLLEAYWREGFHDQTAQLAHEILRDVPGCLKALVLLAHVTAPQDMLQSQELMKRAEALDPDLLTAHDLFADHIASGSRDPFLKLLKKSPVVIGEDVAALETVQGHVSSVENPTVQENAYAYASTAASPSDALATWGSIEGWSSQQTLINPSPDEINQQDAPSLSTWNINGENNGSVDVLQSLEPDVLQSAEQNRGAGISDPEWSIEAASTVPWSTFQPDMQPAPFSNDSSQAEPWQLLQNALNSINPDVVWSQPSQNEAEQEARTSQDDAIPVQSAQLQAEPEVRERLEETSARISDERQPAEPQMPSTQEENHSPFSIEEEGDPLSPPAWLSMLTQTERNQLSGVMPAVHPTELQQKSQSPVPIPHLEPELEPEPVHESVKGLSSIGFDAGAEDAGEEESFFGPDWLKSLGAATLDEDQADQSPTTVSSSLPPSEIPRVSETVETVQPQEEVYEVWGTQAEQTQSSEDLQSVDALLQQQETPRRGSWLDSLSVSPIVERHEQQESAPQFWENTPSVEAQPETEGEKQEQEEQTGSESWSSHWSEVEPDQPSWLSQISQLQTQSTNEARQPSPLEAQPQAVEASEQNLITTLEELELELRSRGFIPMEPNSLSAIAQTQNTSPSSEKLASSTSYNEQGYEQEQPSSAVYDAQAYRQEPSLSSALAELGNFIQQPASSERSNILPIQTPETPEQLVAEHLWLASLNTVPTPVTNSFEPEVEGSDTSQQESSATETTPSYEQWQPTIEASSQPTASSAYAEAAFRPTFEATDSVVARNQQDVVQEAARVNPLLDGELETTMKRPAVRLQPMQRRALPSREVATQNAEPTTLNIRGGNPNYRERLLRGYQAQLIGDYDNAMQEYRIIIRNTPELLGEVVSNLRALLKLAPKYAAGYRVLGDAYMRQGEYLQAMEAYNKALTMAKKAKN